MKMIRDFDFPKSKIKYGLVEVRFTYFKRHSNLNMNRYFCRKQKIMGVQKLREELHGYINHADERFFKMVYAMSKKYNETAVESYNVDGSEI